MQTQKVREMVSSVIAEIYCAEEKMASFLSFMPGRRFDENDRVTVELSLSTLQHCIKTLIAMRDECKPRTYKRKVLV